MQDAWKNVAVYNLWVRFSKYGESFQAHKSTGGKSPCRKLEKKWFRRSIRWPRIYKLALIIIDLERWICVKFPNFRRQLDCLLAISLHRFFSARLHRTGRATEDFKSRQLRCCITIRRTWDSNYLKKLRRLLYTLNAFELCPKISRYLLACCVRQANF